MPRRFVLLDRDGTLIEERHYLSDPAGVRLLPGAAAALRRLRAAGLGLAVLTNQSGIGRGRFSRARAEAVQRRMRALLRRRGARLDGTYLCPHRPRDRCPCRKPRTGLVRLAARRLRFDPRAAFVVGDKACDVLLGKRTGATTILVRTGYGRRTALDRKLRPDYIARDLREAARLILRACREIEK